MKSLKSFWTDFGPALKRLIRYAVPYKGMMAFAALWMVGGGEYVVLDCDALGKTHRLRVLRATGVGDCCGARGFDRCDASIRGVHGHEYLRHDEDQSVDAGDAAYGTLCKNPALVCSKFVNEANIASGGAVSAAIILVRDSLQIVALFAVLFWQNWQLTLVACVVGPVGALILRAISRRTRKIVKDSQAAIAGILSRVQESYKAERLVKISDTYDFEMERFKPINKKIRQTELKRQIMQGLGTPVTQIVTMSGVAVVVAYALFEAQAGRLTIGEFITFLSAMHPFDAAPAALSGVKCDVCEHQRSCPEHFRHYGRTDRKRQGDGGIEKRQGRDRF